MLKIYECSYFDQTEWRYWLVELLCESEEQARAHIDSICPLKYRFKPYRRTGEPDVDSLIVKIIEDNINLPYVVFPR